jgi:hypothetical protein
MTEDALPNRSTCGGDMNAKFLAEGLLVLVCMVALNAGLTKWLAGPVPDSITTHPQKAAGPHVTQAPAAQPETKEPVHQVAQGETR